MKLSWVTPPTSVPSPSPKLMVCVTGLPVVARVPVDSPPVESGPLVPALVAETGVVGSVVVGSFVLELVESVGSLPPDVPGLLVADPPPDDPPSSGTHSPESGPATDP